MKKHHSLVLSLCALAVVASPLTLDTVLSHAHHVDRSIASEAVAQVSGPVLEESAAAADESILTNYLAENKADLAKVDHPEETLTGTPLLQDLEGRLVVLGRDAKEMKARFESLELKKDTDLDVQRVELLLLVAMYQRDGENFDVLLNDATVDANVKDLARPTFAAVRPDIDAAITAFKSLQERHAALPEVKPETTVAETPAAEKKPEEPKLSEAQQKLLDRAERIIAASEKEEKERSCQAQRTPAVVTPEVTQLQMLMMSMLQTNQMMITMLQMQMQNMRGNYFSSASWPSQSYSNMGIGNPTFGQYNFNSQSPFQLGSNLYYGQAPTMGMPGSQMPLPGSFNFGSDQPGAVFGGFQSPEPTQPVANPFAAPMTFV